LNRHGKNLVESVNVKEQLMVTAGDVIRRFQRKTEAGKRDGVRGKRIILAPQEEMGYLIVKSYAGIATKKHFDTLNPKSERN
jgi:hypothetical protein